MKAQISKLVLDELEYRADVLEESDEENAQCAALLRSAVATLKAGGRLTGYERDAVTDEMNGLIFDRMSEVASERRQWYEAAAWLGILTPYDPNAVWLGRKPGKITIDGVVYEK